MSFFPQKAQTPVAILLLLVLLGGFIVLPPKKAEAVVPVNADFSPKSIAEWILQTATQIKILAEAVTTALKATLIAADTNALVTKEYVLDPLSYVAKLVIRTLRGMVIKWILTGRFEGPAFSTSFSIDAARIAENASRQFLSELTGIDFCAGFNIPAVPNFAFNFNVNSSCTLPIGINQNYTNSLLALNTNPGSLSFEEKLALNDPQNNRIYSYIFALDEQQRRIAKAVDARNAEYLAGGGFLGIRDPATGKIKTPGRHVADILQEDVNSLFREYDLADELLEAIVAIVDTFVQKTINDGLTAAFSP